MDHSIFNDNYYHDLGIFLYLIPIVSAFWAAFALLAYKKHVSSQRYLAVVMIVLGFAMIFSFVYDRYSSIDRTEVFRAINPIVSSFSTINILFYFTSLMQPSKLTLRFKLSHCLFPVLFLLLLVFSEFPFDGLQSSLNWDTIRMNREKPVVIIRIGAFIGLMLFEIYVASRCLYMYFRHRRFIRKSYSYNEGIGLDWIGWSILLFGIFAISDLLWMTNPDIQYKVFFSVFSFIVIVSLFWLGFRQDEVPVEAPLTQEEKNREESIFIADIISDTILEYNTETRSSKQKDMRQDLLIYFEQEKPYLNPNLTLEDAADALQTNKTYLSQLLNREFEMNFYNFVNRYRIQYALAFIEKQKGNNLTTVQLVSESGFKSRSVFYKHFKDATGQSPADYIADNRKS